MDFATTNNEAEYEAVLAGLGIAKDLGAKNLEVRSDSQVIVGHIQGDYEARGEKMIKYIAKIQEHRADFDRIVLTKIPREENVKADALARIGSGSDEEIDASKNKVRILISPSVTNQEKR